MIEKEYKVLLSEQNYTKIKSYFVWQDEFEQINYYYDDEEHFLTKNNITLRIRNKKGKLYLQSKTPKKYENALSIKEEKELCISKIYEIIPESLIFDLLGKNLKNVKKIGYLKTLRSFNNTTFKNVELCLDKNVYLGKTDYELELEYIDDFLSEEIIKLFCQNFCLSFEERPLGKNKRFFAYLKEKNNE